MLAAVLLIIILILFLISLRDYEMECVFITTVAICSFMIPIVVAWVTKIGFNFSPWDGRLALSLWVFLQPLAAAGYWRLRVNQMRGVAIVWTLTAGGLLYCYFNPLEARYSTLHVSISESKQQQVICTSIFYFSRFNNTGCTL